MVVRKNTAPAGAPSDPSVPQSVIAEALELRRLIKRILASDPPGAVEAAMPPDRQPAESADHWGAFDKLLGRLMDVHSHLRCADGVLYDLQGVPAELQPACIVLHNATQALDTLYDELDSWSVHHVCRPKTDQDREAAAAPYEATMTPGERERYRASMQVPPERQCHAADDRTDNRMRAFVASMRPLKGVAQPDASQRGRSLIERLALSAEGTGQPKLSLTAAQVADVLSFIGNSEPVEPQGWWDDPPTGPSHLVGLYLLLQALETSLRATPVTQPRSEAAAELAKVTGTSEVPQALLEHLRDQQNRTSELLSLLERLDADDDTPICTIVAVRMAQDLENALDPVTLGKVLKAEDARS